MFKLSLEVLLKFNVCFYFLTLIFSAKVFSCVVPIQGKEFDSLIKVEWNKLESRFYIRFPAQAGGQTFDNATLVIFSDKNTFEQASAPLQTFPDHGNLITYVKSFDNLDIGLNIWIWWQGENDACPIIGGVTLTKK